MLGSEMCLVSELQPGDYLPRWEATVIGPPRPKGGSWDVPIGAPNGVERSMLAFTHNPQVERIPNVLSGGRKVPTLDDVKRATLMEEQADYMLPDVETRLQRVANHVEAALDELSAATRQVMDQLQYAASHGDQLGALAVAERLRLLRDLRGRADELMQSAAEEARELAEDRLMQRG